MDFSVPAALLAENDRFSAFLDAHCMPHLSAWYREGVVPRSFFEAMGREGFLGFEGSGAHLREQPALKQALFVENLARRSPGVAVAVLVQISLGCKSVALFGSPEQKETYLEPGSRGDLLLCLGNTEPHAGSDVANIAMKADKVDGGWVLNGTKAYSTNAAISDHGIVTAVSDPDGPRSSRLSMFTVDLNAKGVTRKPLNKRVWIPSDLTRIQLSDVFVPDGNLLGSRGRGLQQVLEIFTNSRIPISALTLGTAVGAFELGIDHARKREAFGSKIIAFQAKAFEVADLFARMEAARLSVYKACWARDQGLDFVTEASIAKYLTVQIARDVGTWAADLFGAASVVFEHPVHKFPMDAWGASLGEGTQDIQKLIIYRAVLKQRGIDL
jgi:alkylation response protein AidB-like acyl-CoA dehydrogenase